MYFPYLYGRQSELLAVRAMAKDVRHPAALLPVIEPAMRDIADIARCIRECTQARQMLGVVINPSKHQLRDRASANAWFDEMAPVIRDSDVVLPVYVCVAGDAIDVVEAFLKSFEGRDVCVVYSGSDLSQDDVKLLAEKQQIRYHICLDGGLLPRQQQILPRERFVDIRDQFKKEERNADYGGTQLFSSAYLEYRNYAVGFGDYACIGSELRPGGGNPGAVAIHLVYKNSNDGKIWIEHFLSDNKDPKVKDTPGKFHNAVAKAVRAILARPEEFGNNQALDKFVDLARTAHFPQLGKSKELQIIHHLCLQLDANAGAI